MDSENSKPAIIKFISPKWSNFHCFMKEDYPKSIVDIEKQGRQKGFCIHFKNNREVIAPIVQACFAKKDTRGRYTSTR